MENKDKVNEPEIEKEAEACEENAPEKELTREEQLLLEIEKLKALMKIASSQLDFEKAIEIRETIAGLKARLHKAQRGG